MNHIVSVTVDNVHDYNDKYYDSIGVMIGCCYYC